VSESVKTKSALKLALSKVPYRVESAVLFGSMLSEVDRLGDVDIAIELLPKLAEEAEFRKWCDRRRYAAREQGKSFSASFDWTFWPRDEIFEALRARSHTLSLHGIYHLAEMADVRYRVLRGDPERVGRGTDSRRSSMLRRSRRRHNE
jgi:hypothetical protein